MNKQTIKDRERKTLRQTSDRMPPVRNGFGYCFFDYVVVHINQFKEGADLRTVVLRTGGVASKAQDTARCQRMCRRLKKWAGVKFNTDLYGGRDCDGLFGTVFAHTP